MTLKKDDQRTRNAVAAKLKKAQKRPEEALPKGLSPKRAAAQNRRVSKKIGEGK